MYSMASGEKTYLLADMHIKPLDAPNRRAREDAVRDNEMLAGFLASIEGKAKSLVLLGDTFNFWAERRSKIVGDYLVPLNLFKAASDSGLDIHHVSGNRDFVVGEGLGFDSSTRYPGFLKLKGMFTVSRLADFGIEPHGPRYRLHQAGKTITCVHGDSLCSNDTLFMLLRWLLQNRWSKMIWRRAPWSLIEMAVAHQQGRMTVRNGPGRSGDIFGEDAIRRELIMGGDILVCGHIHAGYQRDVVIADREKKLVSIPPWLDGWYGVVENGVVRVEKFS
jgi:hypothetical protein